MPAICSANNPRHVTIPFTFEQNKSQTDKSVYFIARGQRGTVLLAKDGLVLGADNAASPRGIHLRFIKPANPELIGESPTGGLANYYISADPTKWLTRLPLFSQVRYMNIYNGIDAVFYARGDQLEYDLEISPGANPKDIQFGVEGTSRTFVALDGSLTIISGGETWCLLAPDAYQQLTDRKIPVKVKYRLIKNTVISLDLGKYDSSLPLRIDPVVVSANWLPSAVVPAAVAAALDAQGNFIVTGNDGNKVGILKLNSAGTTIEYSTVIGTANNLGAYPSSVNAIALDTNGNAYIGGTTSAPDFPVTSNLSTCGPSCGGSFAVKLAPDGSVVYSTILASGAVAPRALTTDSSSNLYITGFAQDNSLPLVNPFQGFSGQTCTSCLDSFFAKLNPGGTNFVFASYLHASSVQPGQEIQANGIALDASGNILIGGMTNIDPPLMNPWQSATGGLFLSKFAPDGKTLLFSTRFGGSQGLSESYPSGDVLTGMALGSDGTVFLAGFTQSQDFPYAINSANYPIMPSGYGSGFSYMFATAIDPTLTKVTYSTFLGQGTITAIAVGPMNQLYLGGMGTLSPYPTKNSVVSDVTSGGMYFELDQAGTPTTVSEFGGHAISEVPNAMSVDPSGDIYFVATTQSVTPVPHFRFPTQLDLISTGSGFGSSTGSPFAIINPANSPQISLNSEGPFLNLRNAGSADLHISNITLGGGLTKTWGSCGTTIPAGTSCILTASDSLGRTATGTVMITSDAQPSVQTFTVTLPPGSTTGIPIGDQLWSPDEREVFLFPPQFEGTSTGTISIPIWNVGTADATINSIQPIGSLSENDNCGTQIAGSAVLAPGSVCTLQVSVLSGGSQARLNILYDTNQIEPNYLFVPTVTTQQLTLSANAINFGTQQVNGVAIPRIVAVTNTGDIFLSAPSALIQGDPEFSIAGNTCTANLAPQQSCAVAVQFNPVDDDIPDATLTIAGQQVTLTGQGQLASTVQVSPLELDFPPVIAGLQSNNCRAPR